ncbi:MAG: 3'-5' exonuclease [Pseudomonadota bacterium]
MHCMVFDIETVPDVASGRRLFGLEALPEQDALAAMQALRREKSGSDFMPLHLHKIVAISVALRSVDDFRVWSLGGLEADEAELIQRFFDGIERFVPDLVSWNGTGFDLPVLHYRALHHGIDAATYWENGDQQREFRYNSYLGRYHWRHIDVMDVLSAYQPRARAPLDDIAVMLGFPGKLGMSGDKVASVYADGGLQQIRDYCETDVMNTYLVYLRFERMRGRLDGVGYDREIARVKDWLQTQDAEHWNAYRAAWSAADG